MRYVSTRGEATPVSFDEAVLAGQASDGGLYVPERIPDRPVSLDRQASTLADLALRVLPGWIGDDVEKKLASEVFSIPIPIINLGARSRRFEGIHVVELFHGPTGSFKDFGARFLAWWLATKLDPPRKRRLVLVATSGDTGSAVAEGFSGQPGTSVVVLYPFEGVSAYQRAQLTKKREGVIALAVRGSFDDCQRAVKDAFQDQALSDLELTSANSINIGRLLPQMMFYLWSAVHLDCQAPLFVVPSGNLGNLCAGMMAARSSMPDTKFVAATNQNRYLVDYLADPRADMQPVRPSLSNAMDVAVPSNLERITHLFSRAELRSLLSGAAVSDSETRATMSKVFSETGYVADPHTAVGLTVALATEKRSRPTLVMGTAHPDKYRELVCEATGLADERHGEPQSRMEERVIDTGLPALRTVVQDLAIRKWK